jgi:hypothetical protein
MSLYSNDNQNLLLYISDLFTTTPISRAKSGREREMESTQASPAYITASNFVYEPDNTQDTWWPFSQPSE